MFNVIRRSLQAGARPDARGPAFEPRPLGEASLVQRHIRSRLGAATLSAVLMLAGMPAAMAQDLVTLSFKDAEIEQVAGAFGQFLNRPFFVDPRVKGKVNLEAQRPVSRQQALQLFTAALRVQGFVLLDSGGMIRVLPEAESKNQGGPVQIGNQTPQTGDQVVTQVFKLNTESASQLAPVLKPLVSPNQTITALPTGNALIITDTADNLRRIGKIIAALDGPSAAEAESIPLKHALAVDLAGTLNRLLDDTARGLPADPGQRIIVVAETRSNSLIVRTASQQRLILAKRLIEKLDAPTTQPGNVHVVYLKNAEATRLAATLRSVLSGDMSALTGTGTAASGQSGVSLNTGGASGNPQAGATITAGGATGGTGGVQQSLSNASGTTTPTGPGIIQADPSTNSLIITAPDPVYRNLRSVIEKLDARRAQVFIESLIVEVTAEKAAELGFQFQALDGLKSSNTQGFGGTNFTSTISGSGSNILSVAANPASVAPGLNLALLRGTATLGANTVLNLGLLARALESKAGGNVIATPNLVTLDNEEAKIVIGQNVPFLTGQYATPSSATASGVTSFQTIERKDVGTTLRVRPQVSDGGTVRMQIFQEVSSVATQSAQGPVTNRRAIESNVLVDDGQIIVIGGLIEERLEGGESKVPLLGDAPLVGQLFRYDNRKRVKTNLLVFLRPIIMRTADAAGSVTADRYDYMRQIQGDSQLPKHWALPDMPTPQLPEKMPNPLTPATPEPVAPANGQDKSPSKPQPLPLRLPSLDKFNPFALIKKSEPTAQAAAPAPAETKASGIQAVATPAVAPAAAPTVAPKVPKAPADEAGDQIPALVGLAQPQGLSITGTQR